MTHPRDITTVLDSIAKPSPLVAMLIRNAAKARPLNEEIRHDADDSGTDNGDAR